MKDKTRAQQLLRRAIIWSQ